MKIRAITLGQKLQLVNNELPALRRNLEKIQKLVQLYQDDDIEVQTVRLCTTPFDKTTNIKTDPIFGQKPEVIENINQLVEEGLLQYYAFNIGLCDQVEPLSETQKTLLASIPQQFIETPFQFSSVQIASTENGISFEAIDQCVKIIRECSSPDPFRNLQFAVTCNVPSNTPFFPSAYHMGEEAKISIALEASDEVIRVLEENPPAKTPLDKVREAIKVHFTQIYDRISSIAVEFCNQAGFMFAGIDITPAPYPTPEKSIGTVLEKVGLCHFGEIGSVFAVGFLTQSIKSVERPYIGFSGFMQPILEDATISLRNNEGKVDITKILLYSTMCGLGLDCIPIPGDTNPDTMRLLLMDLAMISLRLKKPLTARLMPIPNKKSGEMTEFDFEFFTNSKICSVPESHVEDLDKFRKTNPGFLF